MRIRYEIVHRYNKWSYTGHRAIDSVVWIEVNNSGMNEEVMLLREWRAGWLNVDTGYDRIATGVLSWRIGDLTPRNEGDYDW